MFFCWNLPRSSALEHDHFFSLRKPQLLEHRQIGAYGSWIFVSENGASQVFVSLDEAVVKLVLTLLKGHRFFCYTKSWIAGEILEKISGNSPQTKYGNPRDLETTQDFNPLHFLLSLDFERMETVSFPLFKENPHQKITTGNFFTPQIFSKTAPSD